MSLLKAVELSGVVTALLYLILVTQRRQICWFFYIVSSILYIPVFWSASLFADATLQIYFVVMGVYSWISWGKDKQSRAVIVSWPFIRVFGVAAFTLTAGLLIGTWLSKTTAGQYGYFDGLISVGSIVTTILTAWKVFEGWWFWIVINVTASIVFGLKGLDMTVGLYVLYTFLSVRALLAWRAALRLQKTFPAR